MKTTMNANGDLLCVADTKLVLGNWFAECVMNGRSLPDFAAMLGMCTASYGQTRAIYQHLAPGLDAYAQLERGRGACDIRSMEMLDVPPQSWEDLVVAGYLAEQATWAMMSGFLSHPDRAVAAIARKVGEEAYFHIKYATGWFQVITTEEAGSQRLSEALERRFPLAREWFGPESENDSVHEAGERTATVQHIAEGFARHVSGDLARVGQTIPDARDAERGVSSWDSARRRRGDLPASLFELIRFKDPEFSH